MHADRYIRLFSVLGERLSGFGSNALSRSVIADAVKVNPWFTMHDIVAAVDAIRSDMLQPEILTRWMERYRIDHAHPTADHSSRKPASARPKNVAVIMAGNIPLVGFSDLLAVVASGHACHIKMSNKDKPLMEYVVGLIKEIDAGISVTNWHEEGRYDAVIATGSDNSNRYFRSAFAGIPSLFRGSRSSAGIIGGSEPDSLLMKLSGDMFRYSGLGCRNVSLVFIPETYDIERLGRLVSPAPGDINPMYFSNYKHTKALLSVKGEPFVDCGHFLMREQRAFPTSVSCINYCRYDRAEKVEQWLEAHDSEIQCVVTQTVPHPRAAAFGQAHHPYPWDWPDGRDVIMFLRNLE